MRTARRWLRGFSLVSLSSMEIGFSGILRSGQERAPHGFAHFAGVGVQPERGLPVDGNRLQHALPALTSGEDHHGAIRRVAWTFILAALRQDLQVAGRKVLHADAIRALVEREHRKLLAIRRNARSRVV